MCKKSLFLASLVLFSGLISTSEGAVIFFEELFDDSSFASRGWYDGNKSFVLSTTEHIPGSVSSAEFHFLPTATSSTNGGARRKLFTLSDSVYLSLYIKHSTSWTGSNEDWHPHQFHFVTNMDSAYVGPAYTHSTLYIETNEGEPLLALQDGKNIDPDNKDVDLTYITEERAIAGCNGDSDGHGDGSCYSSYPYVNGKQWRAGSIYFQDSPGPYYKNDWHLIEAYFQMNSIIDGNGVADGHVKYWYDGELIIDHENVMLRTGEHPTMRYNQFIIAPYIGPGSPVDQTFWVDNLTVADSRPIPGDINNDGDVDLKDYAEFAPAWRSELGEGQWSLDYEISKPPDGVIDESDLGVIAENWLIEDPDFLLDSFEFYTTTIGSHNPLRDTWAPTGATENYYYLEDITVYKGFKSLMINSYNFQDPYYCGLSRTDAPQDYSLGGTAKSLSLWFRGYPSIDEIYVRLIDNTDAEAVVKYSDAWNISDLELQQWRQWNIDLQHFFDDNPTFDMTNVKTLEVGVGDCVNPRPVGSGPVYFDEIWLYQQ